MLRSCFFSQDAPRCSLVTTAVWSDNSNNNKQQFSPQTVITSQPEAPNSCLTSTLTFTHDLHLTLTLVDPLTLTATSRVPDLHWLKVVLLKNGSASRHSHLPGSFSTAPQTCSESNLRYSHNTLSSRPSSEVMWQNGRRQDSA